MEMTQEVNPNPLDFVLPQVEESEVNILGAIIMEEELLSKALLSTNDFYVEKHRALFSLMKNMSRRDIPIDIATVLDELKRAGKEEMTGGSPYLTYLTEVALISNFDYHLKQVKEAAIKRGLMEDLWHTLKQVQNGNSIESIQAEILKLAQVSDSNTERPEMKKEAFHGLAGEIVDLISSHSETDRVALLANILTAYGNIIGDNAFFKVEADRHTMRINCVLVGDTSKARKGTSWGHIKSLFHLIDPDWTEQLQTGLSSGEGLIWAVRDMIVKMSPVKEKGRVTGYDNVIVDEGVADKRLLVIEAEFATTLKVIERDGNTLSPVIRCAWDTGNLQTLTKNSPAKATGAHISIVGHITQEELLRHLTTTEMGNGFGNRFLWLYVRRSKSLPFGGGFHKENLKPIIDKLKATIEFGKNTEEITWAEKTRPLWEAVYPKLSEGKPGLVGVLTARAEAYVTRLACIYALLDLSTEIRPEHLKAALAFWEYVEASVKFLFRNSTGIPLVNELRELKGRQSVSKTEIHSYLGRNYRKENIDRALAYLEEHGEATKGKMETGKKPREIWDF